MAVQSCTYHDSWYASLLALAETFRSAQPPRMRECIRCLEAIVQMTLPARIGARTHLQLGQIYLHCTKNSDLARKHLEEAVTDGVSLYSEQISLGRNQPGCEDVISEAVCSFADSLCEFGDYATAKQLVCDALENVRRQPYCYCRLLFYLAQLHLSDRDYAATVQTLSLGAEYAQSVNGFYVETLFLLSQGMVFIIEKRPQDANPILVRASGIIESLDCAIGRKQNLKSFLLVLQVCYCLSSGNMKAAKGFLKELQASIQLITKLQETDTTFVNLLDYFQWLSRDFLCILVYIVTVWQAMQCGQCEKAEKYAEKAMSQLEKLKLCNQNDSALRAFEILLLENIIMCRLVTGNCNRAVKDINTYRNTAMSHSRLFEQHKAQFHTLLGLYAMSVNNLAAAESQFHAGLNVVRETDLWTFLSFNLAVVQIRTGREQDSLALLERLRADRLQNQPQKALSSFVRGLHDFFWGRYERAKFQLRDALDLANKEDMNRLSCCALVVLGHVCFCMNTAEQSMSLVTTAMDLARVVPDTAMQLWGAMLLRDLYRMGDDAVKAQESSDLHRTLSHILSRDLHSSLQQPESALVSDLGPVV